MWRLPDIDVTLPKCSRDGFISWTVGVGVGGEMALSRNWSAKVEYLYIDFSEEILPFLGTAGSLTNHLVRFGVNYRF